MPDIRLMLEYDLKKLQVNTKRAETAKDEIDMKLMEKKLDIQRLEEHKTLQDKTIEKLEKDIEEVKKNLSKLNEKER